MSRVEFTLIKNNGKDFMEHNFICSFRKERHARVTVWFLNNFSDSHKFYYSKAIVGH
jgi:hypothetical protein